MDDKTFKRLFIFLLALIVVIVGVTSYLFLNAYSPTEGEIEVELANNSTSNNTVEVTPEKEVTQPKYIGKNRAITIVKNTVPAGKVRYTATLITSTSRPYYLIDVYGNNPDLETYGHLIGGAHVDAITGEFLGGMG